MLRCDALSPGSPSVQAHGGSRWAAATAFANELFDKSYEEEPGGASCGDQIYISDEGLRLRKVA